jgi:A/G-specific adenine glycosylase
MAVVTSTPPRPSRSHVPKIKIPQRATTGLSAAVVRSLVRWYTRHKRDLPWRQTRDPYAVWISEIFLQQTQVETVRPYFLRFMSAFPTVKALAAAPIDDVLKAWEGCGYYARARHLHRAAQEIVRRGGKLPKSAVELRQLPGIGPYASAAIASIAFGEPVAAIDGNVQRVLSRVLCEKRMLTEPRAKARIQNAADALMVVATKHSLDPGSVNQALMDIGATVCMPRKALCERCPLRIECRARQTLTDVTALPLKKPTKRVPHYNIGAAIIRRRGKLLITQRPHEGLLGGLWEFPGGKLDAGETLEECVVREIREELGIEIEVVEPFASVAHAYSHFRITLHTFLCRPVAGRIRKLGIADYRWVKLEELQQYAFPKADLVIIEKLVATRY